jgi:hypothetical protein
MPHDLGNTLSIRTLLFSYNLKLECLSSYASSVTSYLCAGEQVTYPIPEQGSIAKYLCSTNLWVCSQVIHCFNYDSNNTSFVSFQQLIPLISVSVLLIRTFVTALSKIIVGILVLFSDFNQMLLLPYL